MAKRGALGVIFGTVCLLLAGSCSSPNDDTSRWVWQCHHTGIDIDPTCSCVYVKRGLPVPITVTSECGTGLDPRLSTCCSSVGSNGPYCNCTGGDPYTCLDQTQQTTCQQATGAPPSTPPP